MGRVGKGREYTRQAPSLQCNMRWRMSGLTLLRQASIRHLKGAQRIGSCRRTGVAPADRRWQPGSPMLHPYRPSLRTAHSAHGRAPVQAPQTVHSTHPGSTGEVPRRDAPPPRGLLARCPAGQQDRDQHPPGPPHHSRMPQATSPRQAAGTYTNLMPLNPIPHRNS